MSTFPFAQQAMNTTLSNVGNEQVNVAFVTGTVNRFAKHVALSMMRAPLEDAQGPWDTQLRRAFLQAWIWLAFLGGAVLSGIATPRLAGWALLPPAMILLMSASFGRIQRSIAAAIPAAHWVNGKSVG